MLFWLILSALLFYYVIYYRKYAAGYPRLVCCDPRRKRVLGELCPILFQRYFPPMWGIQAHVQTVGRALLQTYPKHPHRRETLRMGDGGHVCLDWYNELSSSQPTLIILPGITGSSDENYVRHWIDDMVKQEYRTVVFNYRGCGNSMLSTTKLYCGANIEDFMEVLDHIHSTIPESPLLAVGVSLGSTQIVKYLSYCKRTGKDPILKAVLLVSVIWNVFHTGESLSKFVNRHTLNRYLAFKYTKIMNENRSIFEEASERGELEFDFHKAVKATSLEGLAEFLILPMFGYSSVDEYLEDWSPCFRMEGITIPVLAVNSLDDPFCPPKSLPVEEAERNPNLTLAILQRGGHIGFLEGFLPFHKNWLDRLLVQYANAVFEHDLF